VERRKPILGRLYGRAIGAVVLGWLLSLGCVVLWGWQDTAVKSDAIVVLGAAQYDGRPSPVLRSRLDHALLLWQQGMAEWVILTGGQGRGDTTSEAAVGRSYLRSHGIPAAQLLIENQSRNTDESLQAVATLMKEAKLENAILVSDPFHMLRLRILAWRYGLRVVSSPTRTSPISANRIQTANYVLSESVKVPLSLVYSFWPS
jgi:uncharacterized SAM-binding protein YcdF (DUF218 family)